MKKVSEKRRRLLQHLEPIIGKHCYNDFIQNWDRWEHVDDGRMFRYPVTFLQNGQSTKCGTHSYKVANDSVLSGHYHFGANDLLIMAALNEVVSFLEKTYGFDVETSAPLPDNGGALSYEKTKLKYEIQFSLGGGMKIRVSNGPYMSLPEFERRYGFRPPLPEGLPKF